MIQKRKILFLVVVFLSFLVLFNYVRDSKADDYKVTSEVGQKSKISSVVIQNLKTGTAPFDGNDLPGNDSSIDNNIIRSFDSYTFNTELNLVLKEGNLTSLKGGIIKVKGTLPKIETGNNVNKLEWDTAYMNWATNVVLSSDKLTFTAEYELDTNSITVPGKQLLSFKVKVFSLPNGTEIRPNLEFSLEGGTEEDKYSLTLEPVVVSSKLKIDYVFQNASVNNTSRLVSYIKDGETKYGYLTYVSVRDFLFGDSDDKGIKGLIYPKGDISFDLKVKLTKTKDGVTEDITNNENSFILLKGISNCPTSLGYGIKGSDFYMTNIPYGSMSCVNNTETSIKSSGSPNTTEKERGYFNIRISNYALNNIFVIRNTWGTPGVPEYTKRYANIGAYGFYFLTPREESDRGYNYKMTYTVENFKITGEDDSNITLSNKTISYGNYSLFSSFDWAPWSYFANSAKAGLRGPTWGDHAGIVNYNTNVWQYIGYSYINGDAAQSFSSYDILFRIPNEYTPTGRYELRNFNTFMKFKTYYITKKDGTNWSSVSESNMYDINPDNSDFYNTLSDVPANKKIIGVLIESYEGSIPGVNGVSRDGFAMLLELKPILANIKIGQTIGGQVYGYIYIQKV